MRTKWYFEFSVVLLMIVLAIIMALNINFPSCNKIIKKTGPDSKTASDQSFPGKEKWLEGKSLFKSNCAACHNPKAEGIGPVLKGVTDRWKAAGPYQGKTGEQWMKLWIHNWNEVVDSKYKYGVDLANSRLAAMNTFPFLKDEEIDLILFYVENPDLDKAAPVAKE